MSEVERVTVKGKRTYTSKREKPPMVDLLPIAVEAFGSIFPRGGESPSVTTVLGTINKPALIGWAAREERKMVAALADKLYRQLAETIEGQVDAGDFASMLNDQLGKGAHLQLLAKASNVGSQVHARIEWEFKGELGLERKSEPPALTSEQAVRAFKRWEEWRKEVQLKPLMAEHMLHSAIFGYGGTLDLIAEVWIDDAAKDSPFPHLSKRKVVIDFKTGKSIYAESWLQNIAYRMALLEEGIKTDGGIIVRLPKYEEDPEFDAQMVPNDPDLASVFLALLVVHRWVERTHPKKTYSRKKKVDNPPAGVVESSNTEGNTNGH